MRLIDSLSIRSAILWVALLLNLAVTQQDRDFGRINHQRIWYR